MPLLSGPFDVQHVRVDHRLLSSKDSFEEFFEEAAGGGYSRGVSAVVLKLGVVYRPFAS